MISRGRYRYHKDDIAEFEAKPKLNPIEKTMLEGMKKEVAEYEDAHPEVKNPSS